MGSTATVAFFLVLAALPAVFAVTFQVGDALGWANGVDYTTWATGKTFRVGDTLEFTYGPSHSVSVVDKAAYDNCDNSPVQSFSGGDTKIDLTTVGTIHFICPTPGHCQGGMKLAVPVLAAAPAPVTPSPPSSPRSPPPSPRSPPPSPKSPPSSTPSPKSPPSSTPSPPLAPRSPRKPKTPPPSASPPANSTPESESSTPSPSPSPSTSSPSPSPSPSNAASKGVMSYEMIGATMVLMYGLIS